MTENFIITSQNNFWDAATSTDEWDHSLAAPAFSTSKLITVTDVTGQTRISATEKVILNVSLSSPADASGTINILNSSGSIIAYDQADHFGGGYLISTSAEVIVDKNDYIVLSSSDPATSRAGALSITASKFDVTFLAAVPVQKVCYLKDVKSSGTAGGGATAGWNNRSLNTVTGNSEIVSLSSDVFTLEVGEYIIDFHATAKRVNGHQAAIYDNDNSTYEILGIVNYSAAADSSFNHSSGGGKLTLSTPTAFRLKHYVETTKATDGFGDALSSGEGEVYSEVKITKLR